MNIFEIALRNLKRNKRRTILATISVAVASLLVVLLYGLVDGLVENIIKNSTKNDTGHIKIVTKDYFEEIDSPKVYYMIENPQKVKEFLLQDKFVTKKIILITERIKFPILLQNKGLNKTVLCIAGDIEKERSLIMLDKSIISGSYLTGYPIFINLRKFREVIIGKKIAEVLGLDIGDTFSLMLQSVDLGIHIPNFYVRGIFNTGLNVIDENIVMMNIKDAKELLKTENGVHEILIMLKNYKEAPKLASYINKTLSKRSEFKNLVASDWKKSSGFVKMMEQAMKIYNFLYFAILFLGSFIITNIVLMVIFERKKEIGILKSMGYRNLQVLLLFSIEGVFLGLIGSIVGVLLGIIISIPLSIYGIDFSSSMGNMNYPIDNVIRWKISFEGSLFTVLIAIIVAFVMSVIPSRHAAKIRVVDALKGL